MLESADRLAFRFEDFKKGRNANHAEQAIHVCVHADEFDVTFQGTETPEPFYDNPETHVTHKTHFVEIQDEILVPFAQAPIQDLAQILHRALIEIALQSNDQRVP